MRYTIISVLPSTFNFSDQGKNFLVRYVVVCENGQVPKVCKTILDLKPGTVIPCNEVYFDKFGRVASYKTE